MNKKSPDKIRFHLYEYIVYWPVTIFILLLAIPVLIVHFLGYLVRSTGAPLKSAKNLAGFVIVIVIISSGYITYEVFAPSDFRGETRSLMVNEEDRFPRIASNLHMCGVIKSEYIFRMAAVVTGVDKMIVPGRYDFTGKVSLNDILDKFRKHDIATLLLTIPEGSTVYRTASLLATNLRIDSAAFVARAFDTVFTRSKYGIEGLEGYLFPETYLLWHGIKIDGVIDMMLTQFKKRTEGIFDSLPPGINSAKEALTLASIIEAEAGDDGEMSLISSVYNNRLREKMLLQADPTVIYALGGQRRSLTYNDLKFDSPYNTYNYIGLPPGPINSPGMAALKAALHPAVSDYIYFVADGLGKHIFSKTLDEHNTARLQVKIMQKFLTKD